MQQKVKSEGVAVVFVCLGNICRSPVAEAVFRHLVRQRGLEQYFRIESRGTGDWHVGGKAHRDSCRVAKARGVSLESHRARQFEPADFEQFDLVIAMDTENYEHLSRMKGAKRAKLKRLREFDSPRGEPDVPDPYYGGPEGFEEVHDIVERACRALLEELEAQVRR